MPVESHTIGSTLMQVVSNINSFNPIHEKLCEPFQHTTPDTYLFLQASQQNDTINCTKDCRKIQ